MEVKYRLIITSFIITAVLLVTIILFGSVLNEARHQTLSTDLDRISSDFDDLQTLSFLADSFDNNLTCLAFESKLHEMDSYLWDMGSTLDKYRSASEEFKKLDYYVQQKKLFNQNEMTYYIFTKRLIDRCNISKQIILYFYKKSDICPKCDDQSFILRDIAMDDKKLNDGGREVAIFSFDTDLDISSIDLLTKYYKFTNYPCVVINDKPYCGIKGEQEIIDLLCDADDGLAICHN